MSLIQAYLVVVITKLKYSTATAILLTPLSLVLDYFHQSFLEDQEYLIIVAGAIGLDLVVGMYKHFKHQTFDHKQLLYGFIEKCFISLMAVLVLGAFTYVLADGEGTTWVSRYFKLTGRLLVIIYITLPTFVNMNKITEGKFPPTRFILYMRKYNETLDVRELIDEKNGKSTGDTPKADDVNPLD